MPDTMTNSVIKNPAAPINAPQIAERRTLCRLMKNLIMPARIEVAATIHAAQPTVSRKSWGPVTVRVRPRKHAADAPAEVNAAKVLRLGAERDFDSEFIDLYRTTMPDPDSRLGVC